MDTHDEGKGHSLWNQSQGDGESGQGFDADLCQTREVDH